MPEVAVLARSAAISAAAPRKKVKGRDGHPAVADRHQLPDPGRVLRAQDGQRVPLRRRHRKLGLARSRRRRTSRPAARRPRCRGAGFVRGGPMSAPAAGDRRAAHRVTPRFGCCERGCGDGVRPRELQLQLHLVPVDLDLDLGLHLVRHLELDPGVAELQVRLAGAAGQGLAERDQQLGRLLAGQRLRAGELDVGQRPLLLSLLWLRPASAGRATAVPPASGEPRARSRR